ncbi:hypothetical protein D3C85_1120020 [compost metagenome]
MIVIIPNMAGTNIIDVYVLRSKPTVFNAIRLARLLTPIGALAPVATKAPEMR